MKNILRLLALTVPALFLFSCENKAPETSSGPVVTEAEPAAFAYEEYTIEQLREGYRDGKFTIESVVKAYLDRIQAVDDDGPHLNAVIQVNPDALAIAKALDEELKQGKVRGPMHGIPVLLKDNIDTHDQMETTAGSRALLGSHPLNDSWVAKKLRDAGAVIIGKTNLSEWANFRGDLSSSGWSGVGGQTKNPYKLDRNPCGSSSGSGVAVSSNLCMVAIGTETNGSIVCPSTANGIVGIKPTVGLISRSGVVPISFTQDTPGPMARTVTDAAICQGTKVGVDSADSKTAASEGHYLTDYTPFLKADGLKGKRIGLYKGTYGVNFKVDTLMEQAVKFLKSQGAEVIELDRISDADANGPSFEVMLYEFKDGLNKYLSSLGPDAPIKNLEDLIAFNKKDSVELNFYNQSLVEMAQAKGDLTDAAYQKALATMHKAMRENGIDKVMKNNNLDAIMGATGSPAWKTDHTNGDAFQVSSSSPAAIAGYPNISVPMGNIDGLPVGISFFGRAWSEPVLIEIAYGFEQGTHQRIVPRFLPE